MKINQNLKPWLPLIISIPMMAFAWIPGSGRIYIQFIIYQLMLCYWSVKLQGRGNRLYSFYGLILGFITPSLVYFLNNKTKETGPGEGILILCIAYYSLAFGILISSIVGFMARKFWNKLL